MPRRPYHPSGNFGAGIFASWLFAINPLCNCTGLLRYSGFAPMNVLLVGSGARNYACLKLRQSRKLRICSYPRNGRNISNFDEPRRDSGRYRTDWSRREEAPSRPRRHRPEAAIKGPSDRLAVREDRNVRPTQAAARIESSKPFSKELMLRYESPRPPQHLQQRIDAQNYLEGGEGGVVIKAVRHHAGKGSSSAIPWTRRET